MKYIRTKDGRIVKHPHPNAEVFTFRYEILKVADTIEELCDTFVVEYEDGMHLFISKTDLVCYKELKMFGGNVGTNAKIKALYGAIWTSKGLIYDARMNSEGELELL